MDIAGLSSVGLTNSPLGQADIKQDAVFGIRIAGFGFLISTTTYCEVLDKVQVSQLPNVHSWISGLLNLRGNLVPVFDLQKILSDNSLGNSKRRLFAIDRGEKAVALWIDAFPEIKDRATMQLSQTLPPMPSLIQRFITAAYQQDGQYWLDIQFEGLFKVLGQHQYTTEEMT